MLYPSMLYPQNNPFRRSVPLDGMWKFCLDPASRGEAEGWQNGIPGREQIPVPASFQDFYTDKDTREFCGDYWYERNFYLPAEWQGKRILLRFGAVTHRCTVYVNGQKAAEHEGGFLPFAADVSDFVRFGADNRVVVKGNDALCETNIPCGTVSVLPNGKRMNRPYFDFFNYAGLQRSVQLAAVPEGALTDLDLTYRLNGRDAVIGYRLRTEKEAEDGTTATLRLYAEDGSLAASAAGLAGAMQVPNAHLWQVRAAYLYRLEISLYQNGVPVDGYTQEIGIRTVEIRGTSILINDSPVYLRGFGKHEDSEIVGRGFNIGVMKRDFELMKWVGANSFRTSHYPYSEEIYQQADREGFLILDEVPAVGLFESLMNFEDAANGKKSAFFAKATTPVLLEAHKKALTEMILRDKNHPSVIAWSLLNEPESTDPAAVPYFAQIFDLARALDPQKRPRTFALVGNSRLETCQCYRFSDFISLNRYYGWYLLGGYELSAAEAAFRQEMDGWAAKQLNRPFIFTEYGADTLASVHKLPSVMWSQEYQRELLEMFHRVFDSYSFVKGEQIWNFADFQTVEGIKRADGNKKGIFTRDRQPKDAAYFLKERWESLPLHYKSESDLPLVAHVQNKD